MDRTTLFHPDGTSVRVGTPAEVTRLRSAGYKDTPPEAITVPAEAPGHSGAEFNPGEHTVEQVQAFLQEHPDLADAVIAAEKAGKNRTTLTGA